MHLNIDVGLLLLLLLLFNMPRNAVYSIYSKYRTLNILTVFHVEANYFKNAHRAFWWVTLTVNITRKDCLLDPILKVLTVPHVYLIFKKMKN